MNDLNTHLMKILKIEKPIIQAPMAGINTIELASAVIRAGGLGSIACAMLTPDEIRSAYERIKSETSGSINLNFFAHQQREESSEQQERWKERLLPYYQEFGLDPDKKRVSATRAPFNDTFCELVEELRPTVVSFHFGLPEPRLLERVKNTGAIILSSATTVSEALWLEERGCDIIIAQGTQAGGHRATFLTDTDEQLPTNSLISAMRSKITLPIIAAGGIASASDVEQALKSGASAVQLGTAFLFCPEVPLSPLYRESLHGNGETVVTNIFSGRPARGIRNRFINEVGPIAKDVPEFPYASTLVAPLKKVTEESGSTEFMSLWSGSNRIPHRMDAESFIRSLFND
ncbi:putative dioxygenase [Halobacteriovorax marinus SJ]|uniref:Nitronate monooxygenase n=1 Tax=Halobacteriovorax marinus (strain ATCC BAA-682 / DSM 15412 / SJ) TaxID=862908 RepID=E1WYH4_HALMS|nr:nitronate monooxygenase [Halobacteriovorax marinus]CBW26022.1 putative dioxygenase [Halobacteriovorax marinus SJ]